MMTCWRWPENIKMKWLKKLGSNRVEFVKGQIQDLALDLAAMNNHLAQHPVHKQKTLLRYAPGRKNSAKNRH